MAYPGLRLIAAIIVSFFASSAFAQTLYPEDASAVPLMRGRTGLVGIMLGNDELLVLRAQRSKDHLYLQPPPSGSYRYMSPSQTIGRDLNKYRLFHSGNTLVRIRCGGNAETRFMGEENDVFYLDLVGGKAVMKDGSACDLADEICPEPGTGEMPCLLELKVLQEAAREDGFGGSLSGKQVRTVRIFDLSGARALFCMTEDAGVLETFGYKEAVPDETYPFLFRLTR